MKIFIVIGVLGVVIGLAGSATAQSLEQHVSKCTGKNDETVIRGCTGVLQSSNLSRKNKSVAYINRGSAYSRQGKLGLAIDDFTDAIRRDPRSLAAYYNRGNIYFTQENFDQAIADFSRAISLQPNHALSYSNRGSAYLAKGEIDRAIVEFDKALVIGPKNTQAASNRALAYTKKGDIGGVIRNFGAVVRVFFRSLFGE